MTQICHLENMMISACVDTGRGRAFCVPCFANRMPFPTGRGLGRTGPWEASFFSLF